MDEKGLIRANDLLAIIVIIVGGLGFLLWGIGLSSIGNATLKWLGSILVGLIGLIIVILERLLK